MQDEFHADPSAEGADESTNQPSGSIESQATEEPVSASETTGTSRPAATASSYRDIIAERLARKVTGGTAPSPMAHSSDVERTAMPAVATATTAETAEMPAAIEEATKLQEIPTSSTEAQADDGTATVTEVTSSSRERALKRQQERAALRRGTARRSRPEAELAIGEELPPETTPSENAEEAAHVGQDVIAARLAQKQGRGEPASHGERLPREERPPRGERPERGEHPERSERPERTRDGRREGGRREGPRREERREEPRRAEAPRETASEAPAKPTPTLRIAQSPVREREAPRGPELQKRIAMPDNVAVASGVDSTATALAAKLGISVIVPLYNEQDSLRELTAALKQQCMRLAGPKYEILFVNDGSTDRSGEILQDILATSSRVTAISFRRNLGKSAALAAGFAEAQFGILITMDADLQDDPREFVNLIGKLAQGYDLVSGWKKKRHDPMSKTGPSKLFNWVTSVFSGIRLHDFNCGLKAYRKEVTDSLQVYGELHRYLPALAHWQGFRVTEIPVTHHPRKFGKSKFGSSRFFKGFLDLMSIVFTNRYGKRPLHLFGTIGTLMGIAGFVIDIWLTVEWALGLTSLSNRPLLLLGLLLILVGAQLISLGLLGEMIVKNSVSRSSISYAKEKGRPSAEARERRASRAARMARVGGRQDRRTRR